MDQQLLYLINRQWTTPALDWLMASVSSFDLWFVPLLLLIVVIALKGRFKARAMLLFLGVLIGLGDGVLVNSLKQIVCRPRPHQQLADVRQVDLAKARPRLLALGKPLRIRFSKPASGQVNGRSFPSAHTVNNFCVAIVVTAFYRRKGWLVFVPALLVAYSRIYVGAHWPSDVFISIFIAFCIALPALAGLEVLWRRYGARLAPLQFERYPGLVGAMK